jgi:hypothetical protein
MRSGKAYDEHRGGRKGEAILVAGQRSQVGSIVRSWLSNVDTAVTICGMKNGFVIMMLFGTPS